MTPRIVVLCLFSALALAACNPAETPPAEEGAADSAPLVPETPAPQE